MRNISIGRGEVGSGVGRVTHPSYGDFSDAAHDVGCCGALIVVVMI